MLNYPYEFTRTLVTRRDQLVRRKFDFIDTGIKSFFVPLGGDIQAAINRAHDVGGGVVLLDAGTYTLAAALTGYSSVALIGVSASATVIDFNSTSANLAFAGTGVYTTGTITSIAGGVTVTGDGTSWLANVTAGQHLFLGTRWYQIAAVTADTTIILAEAYGDDITFPGATYRIATVIKDVLIKNIFFKNSSGTGITFTDARQIQFDNVLTLDCNKGIVMTNCSELNWDRTLSVSHTSNGVELTNVGLSDFESTNAAGNGGHNFVLNNVKTCTFYACAGNSATTDGWNCTTVVNCSFLIEGSANGGQGMEMVATCTGNTVHDGNFSGNGAEGIKLTATSDNNRIYALSLSGNTTYGINIAASTCDNNIVLGNIFGGNGTAAATDSGTGTLIRSNIGLTDN